MNRPERSAAIARALASESPGLPKDFAAHVATLAEKNDHPHLRWTDGALLGAFVMMICACLTGWFWLGPQESLTSQWWRPLVDAAVSQPWSLFGVAGIAIVQALTFLRRATT